MTEYELERIVEEEVNLLVELGDLSIDSYEDLLGELEEGE